MKIHNTHFDTYPIIFHHHGQAKWSRTGLPLKIKVFDELAAGCDLGTFYGRKEKRVYPILPTADIKDDINDKLTVFMVTNLDEPGSTARCLDYYGIEYVLVGKDITTFNGHEKYQAIMKFIPQVETEYVMLLDSDDAFLVSGLSGLVEEYETKCDCKMLFQAEGWNFPKGNAEMDEFERSIVDKDNPYKHLNSGIWIAQTKFLHEISKDLAAIKPWTPGDQPIFKDLYKMHYPKIKIDSRCEYFQSLAWSTWFEANYPKVLNLEYKS